MINSGGIDRLFIALLLLVTGIVVPSLVLLPESIISCCAVIILYKVNFWRTILRFLFLWIIFFSIVGMGRYFAGVSFTTLLVEGTSSLGLALGVSCAILLVLRTPTAEMLRAFDKLRFSRYFSYALLSLIRLLPEIKRIANRQLLLLNLKDINGDRYFKRYQSYKRIISPLLLILLEQQFVHVKSLDSRGFLISNSYHDNSVTIINCRSVIVAIILIVNSFIWCVAI